MTNPITQFARTLAELPPRLRWHSSALISRSIYSKAFGAFGNDSVIVRPRQLRGVDRIHIGRHVAIYGGAWLQCEDGGGPLTIGDRTYLGHDVHIHAGDEVSIGSGCLLADGCFVATTDHTADAQHGICATGPIVIGDNVFLGQRVVVLGGVNIGDGATVGAHAVVTKDVPPGEVVAGVPAKQIGGK